MKRRLAIGLIVLAVLLGAGTVGLAAAAIWTEGSGDLSGKLAGTAMLGFFVTLTVVGAAIIAADEWLS